MKRFTKLLLLMVCALSLIVFSVGCTNTDESSSEPHTHVAGSELFSDSEYHWNKCECGEVMNKAPHTFTQIHIAAEPTKTAYTAGETFDKSGMKVEGVCSCGNIEITDYTVAYQTESATEFAATDTYVVVKFGELSANVSVTVGKIQLAKPEADETEFVYSGSEQTYVIAENERYTVTGNKQTNAGSYTVTVALNDTDNVEWADGTTDNLTFAFVIAKLQLAKPEADETEFVYNGSELSYVIAENERYTVTGNKQTNAGSYTVTVALNDTENVEWAGGTADNLTYTFEIAKKKVAAVWTKAESYVYNDTELAAPTAKIVDVNGEDVALTVSGDALNTAGTFTFTATLADDNYELTDAECTVTVLFYNEITDFELTAELKCDDDLIKARANSIHGLVEYYYSETQDGEFKVITVGTTVFEAEKTYYVKAIVAAGDNYIGAESEVKSFIKKHEYDQNGKCVKGDAYDTAGVKYTYSETKGIYYVSGCENDVIEAIVLPAYSDGTNPEKPVTYIAFEAFAEKEKLVKIILPESVTDFGGSSFRNCPNLEYVSMTGVKSLVYAVDGRPDGATGSNNNFLRCPKLNTVIIAPDFYTNVQQFTDGDGDVARIENPVLNIFVNAAKGAPVLESNQNLWTGNVFYKGDATKCLQWNYNESGEMAYGASEHTFNENEICSVCGKYSDTLTQGVVYGYDSANECYYVGINQTLNVSVLNILGTYDDGVNGTHTVKYIRNSAFMNNGYITKVTIHENITQLDGGVFQNCANLQYVSMVGITDMAFSNLSGKGIYANETEVITNNNFHLSTSLKYLIVNKNFNLFRDSSEAQQFPGNAKCIDLYVDGAKNVSNVRVVGGNNGMLSGVIYYKGDAAKCLQWNFVDGEIKHGENNHNFVNGICDKCGEKDAMGVDYKFYNGSYYVAGYTGTSETVNVFGEWDDGTNGKANVTFVRNAAFRNNTTIKKVVLHQNITRLEGEVFSGCSNLQYVSMIGVTHLTLENISNKGIYDGEAYTTNNFMNCGSLTTLIVGSSFTVDGNQFIIHNVDGLSACVNVYLSDENGAGTMTVQANTSNGLIKSSYHYSKTENSGYWHYDENGNVELWA